jgi:hypothetical protein
VLGVGVIDGATDIPGVRLVGIIVGALLLIAAVRAMFGKRKR